MPKKFSVVVLLLLLFASFSLLFYVPPARSEDELDKMISIIKDKIQIDNQTRVTFFSFDKKYINDYGIKEKLDLS